MIPAFYCYFHGFYKLCIIVSLTSGASTNYWMQPTVYWRRTLDIVCARTSFCVFTYYGILYSSAYYDFMVLFSMLYCYYLSARGINGWVKFHVAFHLLVMHGMMLTINKMAITS